MQHRGAEHCPAHDQQKARQAPFRMSLPSLVTTGANADAGSKDTYVATRPR